MSSFRWAARVYWEDTDGGGVVYHANYLRFLERARTEWLRAAGFSQQALADRQGLVFAVTDVEVSYRRPARLDDELLITCEPQPSGPASLSFAQRVLRRDGDELLVEAQVRIACVDARTFRPRRLPQFL
ncbi:MAG: tol-pal system-associated acyl-CoA thioesterase, partial [Steroidobacteraceae bacterium]